MDQNRNEPFEMIRIAVMLGTLLSLVLICGYFTVSAFAVSFSAGIRSLAGILLPIVIGGFLAVFNRRLFEKAAALPFSLAFGVALVFGIVVMLLIRNFGSLNFAPIAELIVASVLTLFLYAPGAMTGITTNSIRDDIWVAYYFGMVSGMLGYVVFMGFPFTQAA
ncbi:MAG: hypothetical protein GTO41_26655 [Burkholderiales bacterium]|nr:hypothetical protein [Burkholderiales bacterium]